MKSIELNNAILTHIKKTKEVGHYLWERQWAERNGGNISIFLEDIEDQLPKTIDDFRYVGNRNFPKESAGLSFFVTGTGERLRDLREPEFSSCIIRIDDNAAGYHILWGGQKDNFRPTSEFITHLKVHLDMKKNGRDSKAIVHTHPIELIALSHHPEYNKNRYKFTENLWKMLPEVRAFTPNGIDLVKYELPGSEALADLTVKSLRDHDVAVWEKHGAIAAGKTVIEAFDYIDVANKGAIIFLKCLAAGFEPEGMSKKQMDEIAAIL